MIDDRFERKVAKLDADGLIALKGELLVSNERARARFSKSRSIRDGESYARRRAELSHVRTRIALLPRSAANDSNL